MEYSEHGIKIKKIIQDNFTFKSSKGMPTVIAEIEAVIKEMTEPLRENAKYWEGEAREAMDARDANEYGRKESEDALKAMENARHLDALWKMFYSY